MDLPGPPVVSTRTEPSDFGPLLVTLALLESSEGAAFAVTFLDYPPEADLASVDTALDQMRDSSLSAVQVSPDISRSISLGQYRGREYGGPTEDGSLRLRGRVFLVGQRAYQLHAITPVKPSATQVEAMDRFFSSFVLEDR